MNLSKLSPILRTSLAKRATHELLLRLEPEFAHDRTIDALRSGIVPPQHEQDPEVLSITLAGISLTNPVGMAAGFNKEADTGLGLSRIGFGFEEVGTITPRPQRGNDRPRIFRLPLAGAIINRMGFNNPGHDVAYSKLAARTEDGVVGVNIGANRDSDDFIQDYVLGVRRFWDVASYLTINVSSPNTPGLRDLQADQVLAKLLDRSLSERERQPRSVPIFLKLAPDLEESDLDKVAAVILKSGVDGLIVSNTTTSRKGVEGLPHAKEQGGLSGRPLFGLATRRLAQMRLRLPDLPMIGVGGVHSAETALAKIEAGADAIQLYTALVYGSQDLLQEIKGGLATAARRAGLRRISGFRSRRVADWAEGRLG